MFILESEMPTVLVRPNIQGNLLPALSNACNSLIAKTININIAATVTLPPIIDDQVNTMKSCFKLLETHTCSMDSSLLAAPDTSLICSAN